MSTTAPRAEWRTSSRSQSQGQCVELHGSLTAIRDSKNPTGPVLAINAAALVIAIKEDRI